MGYGSIIIAGIVQGLTEFFPVSSSGHLAILEEIFSFPIAVRLTYAVFLHFGTFLALVFFFSKKIVTKIRERDYSLFLKIFIGSLPLLAAIPLREAVGRYFSDIKLIGYFLLSSGILLLLTQMSKEGKEGVGYGDAFLCGIFQLFAILPGVSRSGATISLLLLLGIRGEEAYDFSFLLSIPAVFAASLYEGYSLLRYSGAFPLISVVIGVVFAFISGYFALYFLRKVVGKRKIYLFSFYLFLLGIMIILFKR